jgi:hypothetical protein
MAKLKFMKSTKPRKLKMSGFKPYGKKMKKAKKVKY